MCGEARHRHRQRRHEKWQRMMEGDIEAQIRDARRQAEEAIDQGIIPTVEAIKRSVRGMDFAGLMGYAAGWSSSFKPGGPAPEPRSPGHEEERLAILRMVEEGKLSPDDAANLLDAL